MSGRERPSVLPYSSVVGQEESKLALELNHIEPRIGGVLISGPRGTAKSTVIRAFYLMAHGDLPVTLPINATDDRVLGGWDLGALMRGEAREQRGLLEQASDRGLLYIDEVNLLDDHIVNIILDVASTGVLTVQREALDREKNIDLCLVGSMNPEEGGLRPQLLDRFGLLAGTSGDLDVEQRRAVIRANLSNGDPSPERDEAKRRALRQAKEAYHDVDVPESILDLCADVAAAVKAVGHRGEVTTMFAARALAALEGAPRVEPGHVRTVAPLALRHRRPDAVHGGSVEWSGGELADLHRLFA
ncbi:AAA family ATPase [Streptomyces sp. cg35]|uniref:AAA family ATPase n=1 Tax=Streptomyces sp. cg35 TaxID=3421650 RepID=UPI003D178984